MFVMFDFGKLGTQVDFFFSCCRTVVLLDCIFVIFVFKKG